MKKIIGFALLFFCGTAVLAQAPVWGLKGGLNFSTYKHGNAAVQKTLDSKLGYHFGIISHNHLSNKIAIQPEIQFTSQGTEVNTASEDFNYRLNYITVPVMFQYMFNNGFRAEAGPYVGFLVSAKDVYDDGTIDNSKDDYKTLDAGLGLGINYLSYSGFGVGGRYNIGLANISDLGGKVNNQVFQLSAFYMFDHDHKRKSR